MGIVGVISAFNFPHAVFGWNAALALICGNCLVWKGAGTTGLVTIATSIILNRVLKENGVPEGVFIGLVGKGSTVGE